MKKLLTLTLLTLAGCSTGGGVHAPVDHVDYNAISHDPFWLVSIGDDRIVLTMGPEGGRADGELVDHQFPRVLPVTAADGTRRWEAQNGAHIVSIEAKPGSCKTGGRSYAEATHVRFNGRDMYGCGGREVAAGA